MPASPAAAPGRHPVDVTDPGLAGVIDWFAAEARELPWRATRDPYAIWVAEVMSAQTTVTRAADAWTRWMVRWPDVPTLAAASLAEVLAQWQGLGYPRRARDLHRSARIVAVSGWPGELTELPGVGAYVAAAIRCFAHEQAVVPIDVNVRRVLARRFPGGVDTSGDAWRAGQALMEFGQRVCRARPDCDVCPVSAGCAGPDSAHAAAAAAAPRRRQARFEGSLRQRRGRLLREVLHHGGMVAARADVEAAEGLIADGLLRRDGAWLRPPR
ncbi:MAG TPA: A/G-specific adenine glycosylase [Solirubrobacteraceae bacterium]|nr:A/G-specific adenine glycosylase [Solirubrobacteraceae bacterium]